MPRAEPVPLWRRLHGGGSLRSESGRVALAALAHGTGLSCPPAELAGRSVLLAVEDQLAAALAMIELDGVVRRLVLCPPGLSAGHLDLVARTAEIDAAVGATRDFGPAVRHVGCAPRVVPAEIERRGGFATEWILLTSGTTGVPKLVVHTLASLSGTAGGKLGAGAVWGTFYDIRRYGGLQILLRAVLGGGSMVLSPQRESVAEFLARAGAEGVTHISGTPSHWRRALISGAAQAMAPRYVRLSGEIADQAILDRLRETYPAADIAHAFASTEAGVAFAVGDGLAGFPEALVERGGGPVEMKVEGGSLRIRSPRNARGYLGPGAPPLAGEDGFVDTGDMVEWRNGRYHFVGRRGGVINVGGQKVHPEEVEAALNRHPAVRMSLVRPRKSPITGAIVVADIVAAPGIAADAALAEDILEACRHWLPRYKVPAQLRFVPGLEVSGSGKLRRADA